MRTKAFTLLELMIVCVIIGLLTSIAIEGLPSYILRTRLESEDATLAALKSDIEASFFSEDFALRNISAISGHVGSSVPVTLFSSGTAPDYSSTSPYDWFAKLATCRGITITTAAPTASNQPALHTLLFNSSGNSRLLFCGPTDEDGIQRFILVSLMARPEQLTLPAYNSSAAFFNALWNTEWNTRTVKAPPLWSSLLSAPQLAAWNGDSNGSMLFRLRVQKIVLRKYPIRISNMSPTGTITVLYNGGAMSAVAAPNSGVTVTPQIFVGRTMVTLQDGVEKDRRIVRDNPPDVTLN
jgi:prepilin-type N-terminal cleavage/methylation domain-containing protein